MKLSAILSQYTIDTTKASDICRQSNYSLIVICWILAKESIDNLVNYKVVLFFVVMSLYFDFMQYLYRGIIEGKHFEDEESKAKDELGNINDMDDLIYCYLDDGNFIILENQDLINILIPLFRLSLEDALQ